MIKVYAVARSEYTEADQPIGTAESKAQAARMIRKHIAAEMGDADTGITAESIVYSAPLDAYFIDD